MNVSRDEKAAQKTVASDHSILIKPADKGGATVIQNREDYIREGERQLSDGLFYQPLDTDPTESNNDKINCLITSLRIKEEISKTLERKLRSSEARTPELYLLPKIHKNQNPVPGRPIVSANGCPTEKISALLDIFLRPYLPKTKSYLKDTNHFLQMLMGLPTLSEDTILCTLDVTSLYTNIPNFEGKRAVARYLSKYRQQASTMEPSNMSLIRMLDTVLTMNNFRFHNKDYIQVAGTAMGTRVAPTYANIFMSDFEEQHVYTYPKQPTLWVRFIDDIFLIWEYGAESLELFINHVNSVHPSIKFTSEPSSLKVNFLDTWVIKQHDGTLMTDLCTPSQQTPIITFHTRLPIQTTAKGTSP